MFGLQLGRLGMAGLNWSESALWPSGASSPGLWIDPSYVASCYQDSAGTTALSTVGTVLDSSNPLGLVLDRKGGLQLGPELITDAGWVAFTGTNVAVSAGVVTVTDNTGAAGYQRAYQDVSTVAGKSYRITVRLVSTTDARNVAGINIWNGAFGSIIYNSNNNIPGALLSRVFVAEGTTSRLDLVEGDPPNTTPKQWVWDSVSVREIPGLHLSQSTSAARPVASARVNQFTYSETLSNTAWEAMGGASKLSATTFAPTVQFGYLRQVLFGKVPGQTYSFSVDVAAVSGNTNLWLFVEGATTSQTPIAVSSTPQRFSCTGVVDAGGFLVFGVQDRNASGQGIVYMSKAQANLGSTALPYQRVGAASDYTASGFPLYAKFDGVDDSLASATFSAGTLTSSMDCLIAVRRDSAADDKVYGLYDPSNTNKWFAACAAGSSLRCVALPPVVGNPTVWVDGTQLTGGTDVTRGTLHTALTVGAWHILELRGLDLSSWNQVGIGKYPSAESNSAFGKIFLFSSGQDSNRDKARARMASYFGVTLP